MQNLLNQIKLYYVNAAISNASNTDDDSDIVDTAGFDGILFATPITDSAQTGVATLTVEQNSANSGTGMAALSGAVATATSAANDDINGKLLVVDVYRPRERYVRSNLASATANIAFGDTIAILYKGIKMPITQSTSEVADSAVVTSPAEA
ncbi:MAG TPA: hypothetical protein PKA43_00140 [Candidatus Competibacter phosphatis]|nr:hypothetical protein [Candidatus Competibacter phosphatis]